MTYNDPTCGGGMSRAVPMALGAATGIRALEMDLGGHLRGVTFPQVWTAGENTAVCCVSRASTLGGIVTQTFGGGWGGPPGTTKIQSGWVFHDDGSVSFLNERFEQVSCGQVAQRGCTCGFYAYYRHGLHTYVNRDRAAAIISGYGRVTLGTKGFRAEKARIIALVKPLAVTEAEEEVARIERRWHEIRDILADLDTIRISRHTQAIMVFAAAAVGVTFSRPVNALLATAAIVAILGWAAVSHATHRTALLAVRTAAYSTRDELVRRAKSLTSSPDSAIRRWRRVQEQYPTIPTFDTLEQALAEYPTSDYSSFVDLPSNDPGEEEEEEES